MPTVVRDRLYVDDHVYTIAADPLEAYLASRVERPVVGPTPFRQNGYVATWAIVADAMYLVAPTGARFNRLFAGLGTPEAAVWFRGFMRLAWRSARFQLPAAHDLR